MVELVDDMDRGGGHHIIGLKPLMFHLPTLRQTEPPPTDGSRQTLFHESEDTAQNLRTNTDIAGQEPQRGFRTIAPFTLSIYIIPSMQGNTAFQVM
jgi:hypothetical protein